MLSKFLVFEGVFLCVFTKERPILTALKQMIIDEIKQSNRIKPKKNQFFHELFLSFFLTKEISVGKCL